STASGISGIVADAATSAPIPFAKVTVSVNGVHKGGATTNINGAFHIKPIDPGFYSLEATFSGYQPAQLKNIDVAPDQVTAVEIPMMAIDPS
ncbi:MAG TPA: carboxypeptidase-like regulatory domain-containing protein, partial [Niastella sp.]